jgi:hypothetical protein
MRADAGAIGKAERIRPAIHQAPPTARGKAMIGVLG